MSDSHEAPSVLQVATRLNVGGPARHLAGLTHGLAPAWDTLVAAGRSPAVEGELPVADTPTARVPLVRRPSPARDARALVQLRRLIDDHAPAVVATHMAKAGTLGRLAAWRSSTRPATVHTFHGHLLQGYFSAPTVRAVVAAEAALARRTDALVAVSERVRDALLDAGVGEPAQWHVLPIAVDVSAAADAPPGRLRTGLGVPDGAPLVGAVSRLVPVKDLGALVHAVARLPRTHLALVGDGPSRDGLTRLAAELGVADRVHFAGWWADVAAVYADLDVVALTSRNEGTPTALLEAAAAARPIVATAVGGVSDVVADGRTALLTPAGDIGAIAEALSATLADPQAAAKRGEAARQEVAARFDRRTAVAAHDRLYRTLAGR